MNPDLREINLDKIQPSGFVTKHIIENALTQLKEEKITKELDYDQVESTFYLEEMRTEQ
jgi:hypothetical protein